MTRRQTRLSLLALAAAVSTATSAHAYTYLYSETNLPLHWLDQNTATPNTLDIYYDFRDVHNINGDFTNFVTSDERTIYVQALNDWSAITGNKIAFTPSTTISSESILNLGVGDLAAVNGSSGGGTYGIAAPNAFPDGEIQGVDVWLDSQQIWEPNIANGNPPYPNLGNPDFYSVALHEIGHALGLDHSNNFFGNIMTASYRGEKLGLSQDDINGVDNLYNINPTPFYNAVNRTASSFIVGSPFFGATPKQYNYFYSPNPGDPSIFAYYIDAGTTTIFGTSSIQDNSEFHQSGGIWNTATLAVGATDNSSTGLFDLSGGSFTATASATVTIGSAFQQSGGAFTANSFAINSGGTVSLSGGTFNTQTLLNNGTLRLNPTGNISLAAATSGTGNLIHGGPGTTTLTGTYSTTGTVAISGGKLQFATTAAQRQSAAVLLKMQTLTISPNAVLDITNHDLMITNGSLATTEAQILAGFGLGSPGAAALSSSTAKAAGNMFLVPFNADVVLGNGSPGSAINHTFDGITITQSGTIIVKYTYIGDLDFNGRVDAADFAIAGANAGASTSLLGLSAAWRMGDVNLDGIVNGWDFATMAGNFGAGAGGGGAMLQGVLPISGDSVPEPTSLAILGLGTALLASRRPRTRRTRPMV